LLGGGALILAADDVVGIALICRRLRVNAKALSRRLKLSLATLCSRPWSSGGDSGFIEPCQPSRAARTPSGPLWVHEIKQDGYRLMVHRDGARVRCFTRNGYDWANRFPAIVDAALRIKATSFLITPGQ
jgi:ATP-dependent DNA ligase